MSSHLPRDGALEKERYDRPEEKKKKKQPTHPAPAASTAGSCPTICKCSRMPRHWKPPSTIVPPNHPPYLCINAYTKFYRNSSIYSEDVGEKLVFFHKSRAITLLFLNESSPFAIPYLSSPISMPMQSLNRSKNTKVRAQKRSADKTDERIDTQMVRRV